MMTVAPPVVHPSLGLMAFMHGVAAYNRTESTTLRIPFSYGHTLATCRSFSRWSKQSMNDLGHVKAKGLRQPLNCSLTQWEGKENIDWRGQCSFAPIRSSECVRRWWLSTVPVDLSVRLSQIWDQSIRRSRSKARAAGQPKKKSGTSIFHAPANWVDLFICKPCLWFANVQLFPHLPVSLIYFGNECFLSFWVFQIWFSGQFVSLRFKSVSYRANGDVHVFLNARTRSWLRPRLCREVSQWLISIHYCTAPLHPRGGEGCYRSCKRLEAQGDSTPR